MLLAFCYCHHCCRLEYLYRNVLPLFSDDTVGPQARAARRFTDARQVRGCSGATSEGTVYKACVLSRLAAWYLLILLRFKTTRSSCCKAAIPSRA